MPGIGSIHAQQVALREDAASDRRRHDLGNWPERRFQPLIGELDGDRFTDRRQNHEFAAALQAIREAEREPLVRCIREMGDEIRRLRRLVEEQGELLDQADCASTPPSPCDGERFDEWRAAHPGEMHGPCAKHGAEVCEPCAYDRGFRDGKAEEVA